MKIIQLNLRVFAFTMTLLILFQSCVIYHKTPVSLDQAAQTRTNSKLVAADGAVTSYKYIIEENGNYFGVKKKSGKLFKTPIDDFLNEEVFLKNETNSRNATLGLVFAPIGMAIMLGGLYVLFNDMSIEFDASELPPFPPGF